MYSSFFIYSSSVSVFAVVVFGETHVKMLYKAYLHFAPATAIEWRVLIEVADERRKKCHIELKKWNLLTEAKQKEC